MAFVFMAVSPSKATPFCQKTGRINRHLNFHTNWDTAAGCSFQHHGSMDLSSRALSIENDTTPQPTDWTRLS